MAYTQARLDLATRQTKQVMLDLPEARDLGSDGRLAQVIHPDHYWNAVVNHGVKPNDTEYWNDMKRLCPWTVPNRQSNVFAVRRVSAAPFKRRNRFGRIKECLRWNPATRQMERIA